MKRVFLSVLLLSFSVVTALAGEHSRHVNLAANGDSMSDDCSEHLHTGGRDYRSVLRDEESRTIPNQPLNIRAENNGGIHISTWDKAEFLVKLCKQATGDSDQQLRNVLNSTRLQIESGSVSVAAPDHDGDYNLNTLLLVKAPRDARVSMSVQNGGISIRRFSGTAEATAENGGISIRQSTGTLKVKAQNGGISIQDCSGDVTANVENGGLSISLPEQWQGKGLEAHTENGGLVIGVPKNFNSGLELTTSNHVSIICKGDACENGQRTWDNGHRMFRLGTGSPQVRLSTGNGGVVIQDRERSRDMM
jgi:DUF4097 and DUF4098 domain-containing protein YvlB